MSEGSPLIVDWVKNRLSWRYIFAPVRKAFSIPAGKSIRTDPGEYKFPEGVFFHGTWQFDHPLCGIRLEAGPNLDTERLFTVALLILGGATVPTPPIYVRIPPDVPLGTYIITSNKEWSWQRFLRFYVFNEDTVPHTCLGFGWTLAILDKERPTPSRDLEEEILKSQQELTSLIKARGGV